MRNSEVSGGASPSPTKDKDLQCQICRQSFKTRAQINHHLRVHTLEKPSSCPLCKKSFPRADVCNFHVKNYCKAKFLAVLPLSTLDGSDSTEKKYTVETTSKERKVESSHNIAFHERSFLDSLRFRSHAAVFAETSMRSQLTTRTDENFNVAMEVVEKLHAELKMETLETFNPHVATGANETSRPHMAVEAEAKISAGESPRLDVVMSAIKNYFGSCITKHAEEKMRTELNSAPYVAICAAENLRSRVTKRTAMNFQSTHSEETSNSGTPMVLKTRTEVHSDKRYHMCLLCGRSFETRALLNGHSLVHTGEKPFKCPLCDKSFARIDVCRSHFKNRCEFKPTTSANYANNLLVTNPIALQKSSPDNVPPDSHLSAHGGKRCSTERDRKRGQKCENFFAPIRQKICKNYRNGVKRQKCQYCHASFITKTELDRHTRIHNRGEELYECPLCQKCYIRLDHYNAHMKHNCHPKTFYVPGSTFSARGEERNAIRKREANRNQKDDISVRPRIRKRYRNGVKRQKCQYCHASFITKTELDLHTRIHNTGEELYECPLCQKCYIRLDHYNAHMKHNCHPKTFNVPSSAFSARGERRKAIRKIEANRNQKDEISVAPIGRKVRKRYRYGVKRQNCQYCHKSFVDKRDLENHTRAHTGEKPYQCLFCKRSFSRLNHCNAHMKHNCHVKPLAVPDDNNLSAKKDLVEAEIHNNYSDYVESPSAASVHLRSQMTFYGRERSYNSDERAYHKNRMVRTIENSHKCKSCEKSFKSRANLHQHSLVHIGERSFQCSLPGKSFSQTDAFNYRAKDNCEGNSTIDASYVPVKNSSVNCPTSSDIGELLLNSSIVLPSEENVLESGEAMTHKKQHGRLSNRVKVYECHFCQKSFGSKDQLIRHTGIHTVERPYKCPHCHKSFSRMDSCKLHVKKGCDLNLMTMLPSVSGTTVSVSGTTVSEKPFLEEPLLDSNATLHSKDKCCQYCHTSFMTTRELDRHTRIHNMGQKPYECALCRKCFIHLDHYNAHMKHNCHPKTFYVPGSTFSAREEERKAIRKREANRNQKDDISVAPIRQRIRKRYRNRVKRRKCQYCHASFVDKRELDLHIRIHNTGEELYECPLCQKCYIRLDHYNAHMKHNCHPKTFNVPGSAFSARGEKRKAIRKTEANRNQKDEISVAPIRQKIRKRFRYGVKRQNCHYCHKSFIVKRDLERHMRIHTGEKPYQCLLCKRSFSRLDDCNVHMKLNCHLKPLAVPDDNDLSAKKDRVEPEIHNKYSDCVESPSAASMHPRSKMTLYRKERPKSDARAYHKNRMDRATESSHKCKSCEKSFRSRANLNRHSLVHIAERATECSLPDKSLPQTVTFNFQAKDNCEGKSTVATSSLPVNDSSVNGPTDSDTEELLVDSSIVVPSEEKILESGEAMMHKKQNGRLSNRVKVHECHFCQKSFGSKTQLIRHTRIHTVESPYKCPHCQKSFSQIDSCNLHVKKGCDLNLMTMLPSSVSGTTASEKPFLEELLLDSNSTLPSRDKTFKLGVTKKEHDKSSEGNKERLRVHLTTHIREQRHKCNICDKSYMRLATLAYHMAKHTGSMPYECHQCNLPFLKARDFHRHMTSHSIDRPHECPECKGRFKRMSKLRNHLRVHTRGKPYKCRFCPEAFTTSTKHKEHLKEVHTQKPFKCKFCPETFKTSMKQKQHICDKLVLDRIVKKHLSSHDDGAKTHKCHLCIKSFPTHGHLTVHLATHTRKRPHKCSICDKSYTCLATLRYHMAKHTGRSPYECHLCNLPFAKIRDFQRHVASHSDDKLHKCPECKRCFMRMFRLTEHLRVHTGETPYKCMLCPEAFTTYIRHKRHMNGVHPGEMPYRCKFCPETFETSIKHKRHICDKLVLDVKKHMSSHDDGAISHECHLCIKSLPTHEQLRVHLATHIRKRPHKCSICDKSYKNSAMLRCHVAKHKGDKRHECHLCDMSFVKARDFDRHIALHSNDRPYECQECEKRFMRMSHLTEHLRVHTGEKAYQCMLCPEAFTTYIRHKLHLKKVHPGEMPYRCKFCPEVFENSIKHKQHTKRHLPERKFCCETCGKIFGKPSMLRDHMRTHTGERNYVCHLCGKALASKSSLKIHIKVHMGEKQYKCEFCGKSFVEMSSLKLHLLNHLEKNYKCGLCEKAFATDALLRKHEKVHMEGYTKPTPYKCNFCQKSFSALKTLNSHMLTHTGEKTHACRVCGRKFLSQSNVKHHMKTHTGERPFKCSVCDKSFARKTHLKFHIETMHKSEKYPRCLICPAIFSKVSDLQYHIMVHEREQLTRKCRFCDKSFASRLHLQLHLRSHATGKPFRCRVCRRSFSTVTKLIVHRIIHALQKIHRCWFCGKSFRTAAKFAWHSKAHEEKLVSGSDPLAEDLVLPMQAVSSVGGQTILKKDSAHRCQVCHRSFTNSYSLEKHKKVHSEEKPFDCKLCGKSYKHEYGLRRHNTALHPENGKKLHECDLCGKSFGEKWGLWKHKTVVHATHKAEADVC